MPESLSFPSLVISRGTLTPSIEVDNDQKEGKYASGDWEDLIPPFTALWVKNQKFDKAATIWTWLSPSVSFGHSGYSVFVAQFGLPKAYFDDLQRHLTRKLGNLVRFSDYVQPSQKDGWRARIHVQDNETWIPVDAVEWERVDT